jgi:hypothetical protein
MENLLTRWSRGSSFSRGRRKEKKRSEWKKGRVVRQVKGKDGVVRGVVLLHKGHTIERPLLLACALEIRCTTQIEQRKNEEKQTVEKERECNI